MYKGNALTTSVTTANTSGVLLAGNSQRIRAEFINRDAAITVYIKAGGTAATTDHIPLAPGAQYVDDYGTSDWFVIAASGTPKVCVTQILAR